jgi:magnesium transporter
LNRLYRRTAEGLMTERVPVIPPSATIAEVERFLLDHTRGLDTINYVYVANGNRKLEGVLSVKELFRAAKSTEVTKLMQREVVAVRPQTEASRIASIAIQHELKEVPVVDSEGTLLGVVPSHAIMGVLHKEKIEHALLHAGVHQFEDPDQNISTAGIIAVVTKRLPWLLVGLGGSVLGATIIGTFSGSLEQELLLAAFIPAVAYIAGAVNAQSEAITIRTLSLERSVRFLPYLLREFVVGLALGLLLAGAIGGISYFFWQNETVSLIVAISFFIAVTLSALTAVAIPWLSRRAHVDPAVSSGPFGTIVSDISAILIYFGVATVVLNALT